jgi:hypothetical protein
MFPSIRLIPTCPPACGLNDDVLLCPHPSTLANAMPSFNSLLPVILTCDNTSHPSSAGPPPNTTPFHLSPSSPLPIGHVPTSSILPLLLASPHFTLSPSPSPSPNSSSQQIVSFSDDSPSLRGKSGELVRSQILASLARSWKDGRLLPDPLDGWRDELYTVYAPPDDPALFSPSPSPSSDRTGDAAAAALGEGEGEGRPEGKPYGSNVGFWLERAACGLFGVVTFGVHINGYVEREGGEISVWVPRRSATKQTFVLPSSSLPSLMLDEHHKLTDRPSHVHPCPRSPASPPSSTRPSQAALRTGSPLSPASSRNAQRKPPSLNLSSSAKTSVEGRG